MNIAIKSALCCGAGVLLIGLSNGGSSNSAATSVDLKLPNDQAQFVRAITAARTSFNGAQNELAAGGVRSARKSERAYRPGGQWLVWEGRFAEFERRW
jgi:hypothetical protein